MNVALIAAVALLCGVSIGMVIGLILAWHIFKARIPEIDWFRDGGV